MTQHMLETDYAFPSFTRAVEAALVSMQSFCAQPPLKSFCEQIDTPCLIWERPAQASTVKDIAL